MIVDLGEDRLQVGHCEVAGVVHHPVASFRLVYLRCRELDLLEFFGPLAPHPLLSLLLHFSLLLVSVDIVLERLAQLLDAVGRVLIELFRVSPWELRYVLLDFTSNLDFKVEVVFNLLDGVASVVWVCTFHFFCNLLDF